MAGTPNFSPDPKLYPDLSGRAHRICRFVRRLTLWEGDHAGERFTLHAFQEAIIRRIFGPSRADGKRLVRTACIWMPKGNAKTTLAAALALTHFMGPEAEPGGQVTMAAADRENAGIAFNHAHQFVQQDATLASRVHSIESRKTLRHPNTGSTLKAVSSEAYSKQGLNVSFFLADEIHVWRPVEGRKLFKAVTDSMVKRSNPLTVIISTAGEGQGGLAWELWDYSHKVARGEVDDPSFAPIIFAAAPDADWRDERVWRAVNPGIEAGFVSLEELRTTARLTEHFPADVAFFKRFNLDLWIEGAAEPWLAPEVYDGAQPMNAIENLQRKPCWVGVDLSSVDDLTAVVAVFPDDRDSRGRRYDVIAQGFLPADNVDQKGDQDRANYARWALDGHLTLTEGNVVDYQAVTRYVVSLGERYGVQEVAVNLRNSTAVSTALQKEGFTVVQVSEGFAWVAAPMRELKRAIKAGGFRHGGNPVLRMCFVNAVAASDGAENERFDKSRSMGRIDEAVATVMAIGRAMVHAEKPKSVYESRELLVI